MTKKQLRNCLYFRSSKKRASIGSALRLGRQSCPISSHIYYMILSSLYTIHAIFLPFFCFCLVSTACSVSTIFSSSWLYSSRQSFTKSRCLPEASMWTSEGRLRYLQLYGRSRESLEFHRYVTDLLLWHGSGDLAGFLDFSPSGHWW